MADGEIKSDRIPFSRSLAGRLLLLGILPASALMAAVLAWGAWDKFQNLELVAEDELLHHALFTAAKIEESNARAMDLARTVAAQQEGGLFGQRALTVDLLTRTLEANANVTAVYVAYEPDADGKDAAAAAADPKGWMEPSGRFIPYPFRDWTKDNAIAVKPLVDYESSLYYDGVRRAFAEAGKPVTIVTEPYIYDGQLIVEQSHPIVIGGKFRGIGATDRALASIESVVRERARECGAEAFLISTRGRLIVATTDAEAAAASGSVSLEGQLRTQAVAESRLAPLLTPFMRDADADGHVLDSIDPINGEHLLAAGVQIQSGGWTLVFTKPREVVIAPIRADLWRTGSLLFGAVFLAGGLVTWTSIRMGRRLRVAAYAADRIAGGDLSCEIPACSSNDETGVLTRSLQRMQANLNALLTGIKTAGVTLDSSALELGATSREQSQMAHRFGESTAQIASATRQIDATGRELASTMGEVEQAAERTSGLADGTRTNLVAVDRTMRELADATQSISAKLAAISERAAGINGVVTTIAKVADQTNLLSVNAAIEAEKAGEQGRGFLVVAREIRRLADQTAGATLDIESMVREMQSAVGAGVMEMDRFSEKVRRGVDEVVASSRQMASIIEEVEANTDRFRSVSTGMSSQSQGAATISASMSALADAAKRTIASAEEFGRTAEELQRASQRLRESVGGFSLRDGR
ncbi:MAG: Methyl-accepting chemotaxis protein PctA [Planctomycetota bacterium]|jgi:methyl-accepting chemotaxis protein